MGAKRSKYADCDFKGWATKFGILCADGRIMVLSMISMGLKFR